MKKTNAVWKRLLFLLPFLLGTVGLLLGGQRLTDAMYHSVQYYLLGYSDPSPNALADLARWTAPVPVPAVRLKLLTAAWKMA